MASVNSPIRKVIKPLLYQVFGPGMYDWFQYLGKVRDIQKRLVEESEMELLPALVGKNSTVLDIGANFAYYTVRLAELCPDGKVIAFEPIPNTYSICARIVKKFGLKNVSLHQAAVGSNMGTAKFRVPLQALGTHSAGQAHMSARKNEAAGREDYYPFEKEETFDCKVISVDEFLPSLTELDFVKIDIEGAELSAFKGMERTLQRFKPTVLFEFCSYFIKGFGVSEAEICEFIEKNGYSLFAYNPGLKKLEPAQSPLRDGNFVLIHKDRLHYYPTLLSEKLCQTQL